ncbi:putative csi2 protein [Golovinomyces cichoracearum]|uniref:Putative csi2 protein n=1 Tax=Golovinomyces cichoracearum TaxID=62708 RepID=A0A420J700_9PEZI|nr:putative csi2 protein [Golovinomyces cichoracearum]
MFPPNLYIFLNSALISLISRGVSAQTSTTTGSDTLTEESTSSDTATAEPTTTNSKDEKSTTSNSQEAQTTSSISESEGKTALTLTDAKKTDSVTSNSLPTSTPTVIDSILTDLPTLTGGYTIVAPSVPPTQNAPFMRQSTLPEGTVFIVVGAILGFFAVSVLAWRMGVAWCLHRSVRKAAFSQGMSDTKALYRTTVAPVAPEAPFYKYSDRGSLISLSGLGAKGGKKVSKPGAVQSSSNTANLFFSPTAGANLQNGSNRASTYFPAGYYSAGGSVTANGATQSSLGAPGISLSNLSVQSHGYNRSRSIDPSPPDSPMIRTDNQLNLQQNSSILNLNQLSDSSERAPSAYLENLFDGENFGSRPHNNYDRHTSEGSNSSR